jgi:hypothetical protein
MKDTSREALISRLRTETWSGFQSMALQAAAMLEADAKYEKLNDPVILHANLLRGLPARLSKEQLIHLLGTDAPAQQVTAPTAKAESITDCMMNLVDRLGHEAGTVDSRAWQHLLVYAPKLTPPDGWDEAVAGARRSYLYKDALKQSEEKSICRVILDMDHLIKEGQQ